MSCARQTAEAAGAKVLPVQDVCTADEPLRPPAPAESPLPR